MRSLRDAIEYRDDKRQKITVETPFRFRDFAKDNRQPPIKGKREADRGQSVSQESAESIAPHMVATVPHADELEKDRQEVQKILTEAQRDACLLMEQTRSTTEQLVELFRERAAAIEKEARDEGYQKGYEAGMQKGLQDGLEKGYGEVAEQHSSFFEALEQARLSLEDSKAKQLQHHLDGMRNLVIAIVRKVIHVSLETSGEVIKQMIVSAAEMGRDKQWSRVFISAVDVAKMEEDGIDIEKLLHGFSDRIKIVINDDAKQGTCVVEFPDQIIDAGVETQLRNIQELMDDFTDADEPEVGLALS